MIRTTVRWAALWRSKGCTHLLNGHDGLPLLFDTRAKTRAHIEEVFGYIKTRPDLRAEPHGWRMPKAIRVRIDYVTVEKVTGK